MGFSYAAGPRTFPVAFVAAAALTLCVCGGGGGATSGTGPTVPVTPTHSATPTSAPTPDPPLSMSCTRLPAGNPNAPCKYESATFQADVDDAIRTLQGEQPQIFNDNTVMSVGPYYVGLIKILDRKGLCAQFDGEELAVTNTSAYSDQYQVMTSKQIARFGPSSYRATCYPAVVPVAQGALPPPPAGCPLPSSREVACSREPSGGVYFQDVSDAIVQIQKDKPELFDFTQTQPGTDWPRLKDLDAYLNGVVQILVKKGYCAQVQEELMVKRGSNAFNEQYKIDYSYQYIRTGAGIYRSSCYPAAF
jgi:hypothetical protein